MVLLLPVGAHGHQFGAVERERACRFGENQVVTCRQAETPPVGFNRNEAEAVAIDLPLLAQQVHLVVDACNVTLGRDTNETIVQDALDFFLDNHAENHVDVEISGALGEIAHGVAGDALSEVRGAQTQFAARVAKLGEDDEMRLLLRADALDEVAHLDEVRFGLGQLGFHLDERDSHIAGHGHS